MKKKLKAYIKAKRIRYQVNDAGVWYVRFADMTEEQEEYLLRPEFKPVCLYGTFGMCIKGEE